MQSPVKWRAPRALPSWSLTLPLTLILALVGSAHADDGDFAESALLSIAARENLDADLLQLVDLADRELPLTGRNVVEAKVVDTVSGQTYGITLDESGAIVDGAELRAAEAAARRGKYGALDTRLFERLESMTELSEVAVAFWLRTGEIELPERLPSTADGVDREPSPGRAPRGAASGSTEVADTHDAAPLSEARVAELEAARELKRAASALLEQQMIPVHTPFLSALASLGFEPTYVSPVAPLIYVTLPKWAIVELSGRDDVDAVYGPNQNQDYNDIAKPTQKADITDYFWGFDGTGVTVGICEDSRIEFNNPNLIAGTTRVPGDPNVDDHATACAGMVASQHSTHSGMAPASSLFSANGTSYADADMAAAIDWAASTQNLDVINNSWGDGSSTSLNDHDRHYDYVVRNLWSTVTVAAGNDGGGCQSGTNNVGSPGKAFSVITVGGFNDQNTVTWDDDALYVCTSTGDPITGAEKPEVAASAVNITSTTASSPWNGPVGSGTSYATPMVSGLAASIMEVNPTWASFPERVKATILASSLHNIEGDSRLSETDGVGGIDMRAGVHVASEGTTDWRSVSTSTTFPYSITKHAFAGERVRAAIAWDSSPSSDYSSDPLQADFDLRVKDPNGTFVQFSSSGSNPFEILDFVAATTGTYTFEVVKFSMSSTVEYIGFAAWSGSWSLDAYASQYHSSPDPVEDYYRYNPANFWNVVAMKPLGTSDYDLIHNVDSPWEDPADYDPNLDDFVGGSGIEFLLTDRNHVPAGDQFLEVRRWSGADDYVIEHATHTLDIYDGIYGPYTLAVSGLARIFDMRFIAGTRRYVRVVPSSGDVDLGIYLYKSDATDDTTFHQFFYDYVASSNFGLAGEEESFDYQTTETDWLGFVVASRNPFEATTSSDYTVYSDTTAPDVTFAINGGATQTGCYRVELNIVAEDFDTGIRRLRYRDTLGAWSSWVDYVGIDLVTVDPRIDLSGSGVHTVEVQVENMAGMVATATDAITLYACPQPAGALTNGDFSNTTGFPWCFSDESSDGFVEYSSAEAIVYGPNDGDGFQRTFIAQRVNVTSSGTHVLSFDWSYGSFNSPTYDGAYYDLVNASTGASLIGGPQTLTDTPATSGAVVQPFIGPVTVEIQLGTFATDSIAGAGFSTFDNVAITQDPCLAVASLSCGLTGSNAVQLSWTNPDAYVGHTVYRDGAAIATLPGGSATSYTDNFATPGSHTYAVQASCGAGDLAPQVTCTVSVPCDPVTSLSCNTGSSSVNLSWVNNEAYSSILIFRNGTSIATLGGGATSYTDGPSVGSYTYEVIGQCGAIAAPAATCAVTTGCPSITGLGCAESGAMVTLDWTIGGP
ncbi:MAG: S8 family serine peptidase, partial [Planctomycetes bacterium]|nr:S8 family serine peptidase [Planctomycetota bacterium]